MVSRRAVLAGLAGGSVVSGLVAGVIALGESGGFDSGGTDGGDGESTPSGPTVEARDWRVNDGFERRPSAVLDGYEVVEGGEGQFGTDRRLDGVALLVRSPIGSGNATVAVGDDDRKVWRGTGTVAVDFLLDANAINRNAAVYFGPGRGFWRVKAGFGGAVDRLRLVDPSGETVATEEVGGEEGVDPRHRHFLEVTVTDRRIRVETDVGELSYEYSGPTPPGTVAVGLRGRESKGGRTWFDNLRIASP